jgi:L-alanine-DL-glutamate epimerase-like enolase superfamily enzyme
VAEQAQKVMAKYGIRTFKLKAGLEPDRDTAMLRAVRASLGPSVRLYLDANHAYPSLVAAKTMKRWEEYDVAWCEEPCPVWDRGGRALIARSTSIPMMADESCKTVPAVTAEIAYGHSRLISVKTGGTGYTLSNRIRVLCEAHGLVPVSGSQSDSDLGAVAAAHFNAAAPLARAKPGRVDVVSRCGRRPAQRNDRDPRRQVPPARHSRRRRDDRRTEARRIPPRSIARRAPNAAAPCKSIDGRPPACLRGRKLAPLRVPHATGAWPLSRG